MTKYILSEVEFAIPTLASQLETEEFLIKLGNKIREIREAKKLSQSDIARELFKDRQSIQRLETGKANITVKMLKEIADVLKIEVKDFFDF